MSSADYRLTYDPVTKQVTVELLKDTSETIAVFIAVEAATDVYKYNNMISLTDGTTDLTAEAQVEKSAKGNWLTKMALKMLTIIDCWIGKYWLTKIVERSRML